MTRPRSRLPLGLLALLTIACGDDGQAPPQVPPPAPARTDLPAPAPGTGTGGDTGGTTAVDPFGGDDWGEDDTDSEGVATVGMEAGDTGDTDGEAAAPPVYDGPCFVRWSKGPVLRFKYDADGSGGSLRIDGDNDGTNEICARFWTKDDRTNKVTVDAGCDKSTDAIITPSYEEGVNLATATYTDKSGGTDTEHEITLITLPAFTGIAPGYPLYAKRDDIELDIKDGLVRKATVKKPVEGPSVRVTLTYDDKGRAKQIKEDHGVDGKIDRRYDYRYDDVGNVTGITLQETDFSEGKGTKTKKTARLGYSCWAGKTTPAPVEAPAAP